MTLICGSCAADLGPDHHEEHWVVGGGIMLTYPMDSLDAIVGKGGKGVRVLARDGSVLHECGTPDAVRGFRAFVSEADGYSVRWRKGRRFWNLRWWQTTTIPLRDPIGATGVADATADVEASIPPRWNQQ